MIYAHLKDKHIKSRGSTATEAFYMRRTCGAPVCFGAGRRTSEPCFGKISPLRRSGAPSACQSSAFPLRANAGGSASCRTRTKTDRRTCGAPVCFGAGRRTLEPCFGKISPLRRSDAPSACQSSALVPSRSMRKIDLQAPAE